MQLDKCYGANASDPGEEMDGGVGGILIKKTIENRGHTGAENGIILFSFERCAH
jgi:hypothetical protein